jgi:tRNA modification GTPase
MHTVVALASPLFTSALAIIRISGEESLQIASIVLHKKINKKGIYHSFFYDKDTIIDEVIALAYIKPLSFTGEDSIEFICHGSILIIQQIISTLIALGCQQAKNGEFSQRAYLNGKIDLLQAEAINDLILSSTNKSKDNSILILQGELSKRLKSIFSPLVSLLANLEVNIDYPEYYDIHTIIIEDILPCLVDLSVSVNELLKEAKYGLILTSGVNVGIIGKPNIGKSTLLNTLIKEDKAIVSNIPGTTRDIVEGKFTIDGILFNIYDTAGIHETNDVIEEIGINKAKNILSKMDIVIYLVESENENELDNITSIPIIKVLAKADLIKISSNLPKISAINNDVKELIEAIKEKLDLKSIHQSQGLLNNSRHIGLLKQILNEIHESINILDNTTFIDIIYNKLENISTIFKQLLGDTSDEMYQEIFSKFCVGK